MMKRVRSGSSIYFFLRIIFWFFLHRFIRCDTRKSECLINSTSTDSCHLKKPKSKLAPKAKKNAIINDEDNVHFIPIVLRFRQWPANKLLDSFCQRVYEAFST